MLETLFSTAGKVVSLPDFSPVVSFSFTSFLLIETFLFFKAGGEKALFTKTVKGKVLSLIP